MLSLFPLQRAAEIALAQKGTEVGDLAVSFLALASIYDRLNERLDEAEQALEVSLVRLGIGEDVK